MHVIGYMRVSTDEQARSGLGLEAQRARIEAEAARRGWTVSWYADEGWSAKTLKRPGIAAALAALKRGDAQALVVAKLDRLSRSVLDFADVLRTGSRQGWAVVALDLGVDTTTAAGELVAGVMMQVAQWERRVIGERTAAAIRAKQARGEAHGRPVALLPSAEARLLALRGQGLGARRIATALNDEAVPTAHGGTWHPSTVTRILTRLGISASAPARHSASTAVSA